jgi:hypothetical protein
MGAAYTAQRVSANIESGDGPRPRRFGEPAGEEALSDPEPDRRATVVFAGQGPEEGHNVVNVTVPEQAPELASHHANGTASVRAEPSEVGRRQDREREGRAP